MFLFLSSHDERDMILNVPEPVTTATLPVSMADSIPRGPGILVKRPPSLAAGIMSGTVDIVRCVLVVVVDRRG